MLWSGVAQARACHMLTRAHYSSEAADACGTSLVSLNFSIGAHIVHLFKLSKCLVKIPYRTKTI